ncbi:retroviral-like aspartic protease family protein [Lacinutrix neustonica]|uniref:Retroviral-like aspartic protease family protein n=1 Tax=Lacinutrix neustonica TaxID=2980107 RepID=A0A9E8SEA2_9FLAO|nr:retroviral-like aspartic protease family protein [Lacinutrix neustonica]WAC02976.1 retroviral-like aspartic protease family protein [Lacinutrix neustonica]
MILGASEISISLNLEDDLISKGLLKKEDYIESGLYRIADGSIISCRRIIIKELKVGNFTIKNVVASIGFKESPLLLGKSFLDNFKKWSIDNDLQLLILEK